MPKERGIYPYRQERGYSGNMMDRVAECVYPERASCKGCSWSYATALYDGGCMLHYEGVGQNLQRKAKRTTAGKQYAENRKIKRGISPAREERRR